MKINNKVIRILAAAFFVLIFSPSLAQIGGSSTYQFLNLTSSARLASLGGKMVPVLDDDPNLVFGNPALLNPSMHKHLTLSGVKYFADIKYGYAGYAHHDQKLGTFSAAMHYVNYGDFDETDITGQKIGEFSAAEYSLNLAYSRSIYDSAFTVGASLKTIYSSLESYNSFGMAVDLGANYYFEKPMINLSLVAKNIGTQLTYYTDDNNEPLPFDIQLGISKKLEKAPFRLSLVLHHLEKFDITYRDPAKEDETDPITGESTEEKITVGDKILAHVIIGTEVLLSKNFHVRAGYNFQRRRELGIESKMSTVGLSWGFGFRISKFHISYGRATYHLAGASNHFSISTNFSDFIRKSAD